VLQSFQKDTVCKKSLLKQLCRGTIDSVVYINMKVLGLVVSGKKIFENCIKNICVQMDA